MMGVPTHYRMMAQQRRFATTDLSSLRLLVVGGAQMPLPLLRTWHARGRLASFKVPAEIRFVDALPQASLEKVKRSALREEATR
ncbi:hypothetical protein ET989_00800 [Propioniciclava sinopodophylli]|uniref:AMP-dependent synthetase/ligase domain-containing protein n=2 Tax=Propioniciclava sinopodophylli TaxID=1837344 RepID=A0A4V2JSV6_9ACTN|nr:hypothetical protein ET989_00800 [Propioniciclava sinopodophylli]